MENKVNYIQGINIANISQARRKMKLLKRSKTQKNDVVIIFDVFG